jgi:SAM-dependent methyltransferase
MLFKYFHLRPILQSAYYANRWRLKKLLKITDKPRTDVLSSGLEPAILRYTRICTTLLENIPDIDSVSNAVVSEIGCGDCLAAADMMLGLGAKHVHLVESIPMIINQEHCQALQPLINNPSLPNRGDILSKDAIPLLNSNLATFHKGLLEKLNLPEPVDFLYSFDVLEHVDDLNGFFACCSNIIRPGGLMMHKFDLSGHGAFEDPMPPLDFQTLPTWLFNFTFPKYNRAAGNFADVFFDIIERNNFTELQIIPLRVADKDYLNDIWPYLRSEARERSQDIIGLLDVIVICRRKAE